MTRLLLGYVCLIWASTTYGKTPPPYYVKVANEVGVPVDVLYAVALNESGWTKKGVYNPWPWTLNVDGKGERFNSFSEAKRVLLKAIDNHQRVDVGIMQINSYWHRDRVDTPLQFLDPQVSLVEGAKILKEQRKRSDDWWEAVGRYHAPRNDKASLNRAEAYRSRVKNIYQTMLNQRKQGT